MPEKLYANMPITLKMMQDTMIKIIECHFVATINDNPLMFLKYLSIHNIYLDMILFQYKFKFYMKFKAFQYSGGPFALNSNFHTYKINS